MHLQRQSELNISRGVAELAWCAVGVGAGARESLKCCEKPYYGGREGGGMCKQGKV